MECVEAHHVSVTGRKEIKNDLYAVPLCKLHHTGKGHHITLDELEELINEDARDFCIALHGMWIDFQDGEYFIEAERENGFHHYKSILRGG
jgi:hypothetical protein